MLRAAGGSCSRTPQVRNLPSTPDIAGCKLHSSLHRCVTSRDPARDGLARYLGLRLVQPSWMGSIPLSSWFICFQLPQDSSDMISWHSGCMTISAITTLHVNPRCWKNCLCLHVVICWTSALHFRPLCMHLLHMLDAVCADLQMSSANAGRAMTLHPCPRALLTGAAVPVHRASRAGPSPLACVGSFPVPVSSPRSVRLASSLSGDVKH